MKNISCWLVDDHLLSNRYKRSLHRAKSADINGQYKKADHFDKLIRIAYENSGEWWITDSGELKYAVTEVNDISHEDFAEEEILNKLGFDSWEISSYDTYYDVLNRYIANDLLRDNFENENLQEYRDYLEENNLDNSLETYLTYIREKNPHELNPEIYHQETQDLIKGLNNAREYAISKFGWIRVVKHGSNITLEVENLSPNIIQRIIRAVKDGDELLSEHEDPYKINFTIEVYEPSQATLNNVKLIDLENNNVRNIYQQTLRSLMPNQVSDDYFTNRFKTTQHPYYKGKIGD